MGHNYGAEPRLVMAAGNARWFGLFAAGFVIVGVLLAAVMVLAGEPVGPALLAGGLIAAVGLVVALIVPRRFEVYDNRLVIVFGLWRWNIPMESIDFVREAELWKSYAFWGFRFSTKPAEAVELRRIRPSLLRRPSLIISPDDRGIFLAEMNTALARYRRTHGGS